MNKNRKTQAIYLVVTVVIAIVGIFSLTIRNHSLSSLRADAAGKCVIAPNHDCVSKETGNVYQGYMEVESDEDQEPSDS